MKKISSQVFCYWLQGYFEISEKSELTQSRIEIINDMIKRVDNPGQYILWLTETLKLLEVSNYHAPLMAFYHKEIERELNLIFFHVIDNSYDTPHSLEHCLNVHNGSEQPIPTDDKA